MRLVLLTGLLLLMTAAGAAGQGAAAAQTPSVRAVAWEVRIAIRGGILGTGAGTIALDSTGRLTCTAPARCQGRLSSSAAEGIAASIAARRTLGWAPPQDQSTCSDCYTTTMTVRTRVKDGAEAVSVYTWSDVTFADVPDDVKHLYRLIRAEAARPPVALRARFHQMPSRSPRLGEPMGATPSTTSLPRALN
jgi:hypothetical protein